MHRLFYFYYCYTTDHCYIKKIVFLFSVSNLLYLQASPLLYFFFLLVFLAKRNTPNNDSFTFPFKCFLLFSHPYFIELLTIPKIMLNNISGSRFVHCIPHLVSVSTIWDEWHLSHYSLVCISLLMDD